MNLTFVKIDDAWVASSDVVGDFAIHIEKNGGTLRVYQSTVAGATPALNKSLCMNETDGVLDKHVVGIVYPVYIRIEARTEVAPTAIITYPSDTATAVENAITNSLNTPV